MTGYISQPIKKQAVSRLTKTEENRRVLRFYVLSPCPGILSFFNPSNTADNGRLPHSHNPGCSSISSSVPSFRNTKDSSPRCSPPYHPRSCRPSRLLIETLHAPHVSAPAPPPPASQRTYAPPRISSSSLES